MKKIEAIVNPQRLDAVNAALLAVGVHGMTVTDVKGFGRPDGETEEQPAHPFGGSFFSKVTIEIVLPDELLGDALGAIQSAAQSGHIGDGKVFVTTLEEVIRVRTGERGALAL